NSWLATGPHFRHSWPTYPAHLCPRLFGGEFVKFGGDFGEAVGQSIEYLRGASAGVGQRAPKHFHDMLSDLECLNGAGEVGLEADGRGGGSGRRREMPRLGESGAELAL